MRTCQHLRIPAVIVLAAGNLFANDARRHHFPRAYELVELARAAPAEIGANAILSLLERNANVPSDWRRELAEEALRLAAISKREWPVRPAPGVPVIDNRVAMEADAARTGLDRLTLSMRAIDQMWLVDRDAARERFAQYPRPRPDESTCKQPLLPDLTPYYRTAFRLRVPPGEVLIGLRTSGEIAPAVNLLIQAGGDAEQLELWSAELGAALSRVPSDARAFAATIREATPALAQLTESLEAAQRSPAALLSGWRTWFEAGLAEPMCGEPSLPDRLADRESAAAVLARFGPPLEAESIRGTDGGGAAQTHPFENREIDTKLAVLLRPLLIDPQLPGEEGAARRALRWEEYREEVERATGEGDPADVAFLRQSARWAGAILAAQTPSQRRRSTAGAVQFLLRQMPHTDPALWQSQLIRLAQTDSNRPGNREDSVAAAFAASRNPAMALFAALQAEYPANP